MAAEFLERGALDVDTMANGEEDASVMFCLLVVVLIVCCIVVFFERTKSIPNSKALLGWLAVSCVGKNNKGG